MSHSHVFISYSHENRDKLNQLVEKLRGGGYSDDEIWYDGHITAGADWRDEIETKLEEAFAVLVIVTSAAMSSTYVTYEWSWALGNGTPVIPLLFEDMQFTQVHQRLNKKDHIICTRGIDDQKITDTLQRHRETPPDTLYLYRIISSSIMGFRVLLRFTLWALQYADSNGLELDLVKWLKETLDEASKLSSQHLPELMIGKGYAFTSRGTRACRDLILSLEKLWKIFHEPSNAWPSWNLYSRKPLNELVQVAERHRSVELESLMNFFNTGNSLDEAYRLFDYNLQEISLGNISILEARNPIFDPLFGLEHIGKGPDEIEELRRCILAIAGSLK